VHYSCDVGHKGGEELRRVGGLGFYLGCNFDRVRRFLWVDVAGWLS
jgi:hypothetical protein